MIKHLLAVATFAACLAAAPAGAQTVYGSVVTPGDDGTSVESGSVGSWKDNFAIYGSVNPPAAANDAAAILTYAEEGPDVYYGNLQIDLAGATIAAGGTSLAGGGPVIDATGVPEPGTWAMMLVGFGAVGGVLRGRRKATLRHA